MEADSKKKRDNLNAVLTKAQQRKHLAEKENLQTFKKRNLICSTIQSSIKRNQNYLPSTEFQLLSEVDET